MAQPPQHDIVPALTLTDTTNSVEMRTEMQSNLFIFTPPYTVFDEYGMTDCQKH